MKGIIEKEATVLSHDSVWDIWKTNELKRFKNRERMMIYSELGRSRGRSVRVGIGRVQF